MPISLPSRSIGSSRTTTQVLIYRHNRHPISAHGEFDITNFATQITIDSHLTGGSQASISLVPIHPFEDAIAANDIINIYMDTNRRHERDEYDIGDQTWRYNIGNVRVFFGYVDTISRGVSVASDGTKSTFYTLTCSSFDKAVRATNVYVNPHLTHQGAEGKEDVVRADISTNLGGTLLRGKGFLIAGAPRQLIISHLMRSLGFGAQWLLPLGYKDNVYDFEWCVKFGIVKAGAQHKKETSKDFEYNVQLVKDKSLNISKNLESSLNFGTKNKSEPLLTNSLLSVPLDYGAGIRAATEESSVKSDLMMALSMVAAESHVTNEATLAEVKKLFAGSGSTKIEALAGMDFLISGKIADKFIIDWYESNRSNLGTVTVLKNTESEKIVTQLKFTPNDALKRKSFEKNLPRLTPNINQTTNPEAAATPAKTIFNILCLDYLENVDGNFVMSQLFQFGGPLMDQLQRQSHDLMNEFFFDLRPAPDFRSRDKDGLGTEIFGAIPMVPAVVLREKPYTIYKNPTVKLGEVDSSNIVTSGGVSSKKSMPAYGPAAGAAAGAASSLGGFSDQLFVRMFNQKGYQKFTKKDFDKVNSFVSKIGVDLELEAVASSSIAGESTTLEKVGEAVEDAAEAVEDAAEALVNYLTNTWHKALDYIKGPNGGKKVTKGSTDDGGFPNVVDPGGIILKGQNNSFLSEQPYSVTFSLPRPVFRSPDGGRITRETQISSSQTILGIVQDPKSKDGKATFSALGTANPNLGIPNTSKEKVVDPKLGTFLLTGPNDSHKNNLQDQVTEAKSENWHVLEFLTVRNEDVIDESYYRGDNQVINITELFGDINPDLESQKAIISDKLPIITPISVQRNGTRVFSNTTSFVQHLLSGGPTDGSWLAMLAYRWCVMLDMWSQHNHELLLGNLTIRGMPGLRVGYKINRPESGLSFYVDSVSHDWTYPGVMTTKVSLSRGQPAHNNIKEDRILDYIPHNPRTQSNRSQRQTLGTQFKVNLDLHGNYSGSDFDIFDIF